MACARPVPSSSFACSPRRPGCSCSRRSSRTSRASSASRPRPPGSCARCPALTGGADGGAAGGRAAPARAADLLALGAALVALGVGCERRRTVVRGAAGAQAVIGVGVGPLVAVGIAAAGEWPEPGERPHVLAWAIAGMPAAWIAGMPVVGVVADVGLARRPGSPCPRSPRSRRSRSCCCDRAIRRPARPAAPPRPGAGPTSRASPRGELLANAAWASVLTYSGALLLESYAISASAVAVGLGADRGGDACRHVLRPPARGPRDARMLAGADRRSRPARCVAARHGPARGPSSRWRCSA